MAMNRIMGTEAQKMQDYAREQIERAERRGITFPEDVKEDIFRYADLIGEEDRYRIFYMVQKWKFGSYRMKRLEDWNC